MRNRDRIIGQYSGPQRFSVHILLHSKSDHRQTNQLPIPRIDRAGAELLGFNVGSVVAVDITFSQSGSDLSGVKTKDCPAVLGLEKRVNAHRDLTGKSCRFVRKLNNGRFIA